MSWRLRRASGWRRATSRCAGVVLATAAVSVAPASASSIVYAKGGNLYLTSPDGSIGYQLTSDGGWSSPSQADSGTIVALKDGLLWRLDRAGHILGSPIQGIGGATDHVVTGHDQFFGPFDPVVSPDGTQIAYWDTVSQQRFDSGCGCVREELVNVVTSTAADHFTSGGFVSHAELPHWIRGTDRVTVSDSGQEPQAMTWVTTTDATGEQWWFRDGSYVIQDITLSPDGSKVVAMGTDQGIVAPYDTMRIWTTNGPAFTGQPPYDNTAPDAQFPPAPTVVCNNHHGGHQLGHPSWSPDSSAVAFDGDGGIWINRFDPGMTDCGGLHEHLLIAGGQSPSWGPADVDPAQAPGTHGGGPPGGGPGAGGPGTGGPGPGTGGPGPGTGGPGPGTGGPGPGPGGPGPGVRGPEPGSHPDVLRLRVVGRTSARALRAPGLTLDLFLPRAGTAVLTISDNGHARAHRRLSVTRGQSLRLRVRLERARPGDRVVIILREGNAGRTVGLRVR